MSLPHEIQITLADLVYGGVLERFPKLKIVSAENDVSWLRTSCIALNHGYDRLRHFENVNLSMMPSEYVKRQVWATFQFEDVWIDNRNRYDMTRSCGRLTIRHTDRRGRVRNNT